MSDILESKPAASDISIRPIIMKRLFSFLGIMPLGIYVIVHLWHNNYSWQGEAAFNKQLIEGRSWPFYQAITILFLYIPLLYHTFYGIFVASRARKTMVTQLKGNYYFQMLKYTLQRLSGLGLVLFIGAHLYKTKIETGMHGEIADYAHMREGLMETITQVVYYCGILGVAYHLANGLWSALITWGITINERSQRISEVITIIFFFVITALGLSAMYGFIQ